MLEAVDIDSDFDVDDEICQTADRSSHRTLHDQQLCSRDSPIRACDKIDGIIYLDDEPPKTIDNDLDRVAGSILQSSESSEIRANDQDAVSDRTTENKQIELLDQYSLRISADKCEFIQDNVTGQLNSSQQLSVATEESTQQLLQSFSAETKLKQLLDNTDKQHLEETVSNEQQLLQTLRDKQLQFEAQLAEQQQWHREKDLMVMRYAEAERKNLELKNKMSRMGQQESEWMKERESVMGRMNMMKAEKQKMSEQLEHRAVEIVSLRRELERGKEIAAGLEGNLKWLQNKVRVEIELHKETRSKLEETGKKLKVTSEELDSANKRIESLVKKHQEAQVMQMVTRELQMKETEQELMTKKQEQVDQQELYQLARIELELLKAQQKELVVELSTYKDKVTCLESERLYQEQQLSQFKVTLQNQKTENKELTNQVAELIEAKSTVERLQEDLERSQQKCDELQQLNLELQSDMDSSSHREGQHLMDTQRLSSEVVKLQSDRLTHIGELESLRVEVARVTALLSAESQKSTDMVAQLSDLTLRYEREINFITERLKEKTLQADDLKRCCEERDDDIKTLKRKHQSSNKDLMRQLASLQKQLESCQCRAVLSPCNGNTVATTLHRSGSAVDTWEGFTATTDMSYESISHRNATTDDIQITLGGLGLNCIPNLDRNATCDTDKALSSDGGYTYDSDGAKNATSNEIITSNFSSTSGIELSKLNQNETCVATIAETSCEVIQNKTPAGIDATLLNNSNRNATSRDISSRSQSSSNGNATSLSSSSHATQNVWEKLDRVTLVRKILKLQSMVGKLNEKVEFLQEHNQRLTVKLVNNGGGDR